MKPRLFRQECQLRVGQQLRLGNVVQQQQTRRRVRVLRVRRCGELTQAGQHPPPQLAAVLQIPLTHRQTEFGRQRQRGDRLEHVGLPVGVDLPGAALIGAGVDVRVCHCQLGFADPGDPVHRGDHSHRAAG